MNDSINPAFSAFFAVLTGLLIAVPASADYSNDFASQSDADFTRYSPLAGFGAGGVFTFPSGSGYRIGALASPAPSPLGPARAAAFITGQTFGDFTVSYTIRDYSTASPQFLGVFSRVSTPGLGTLNGYAMGLDTSTGQIFISRVQGEASQGPISPSAVSSTLSLVPSQTYSLSFSAMGPAFNGSIADSAGTVLATISGVDGTYAVGQLGLGVAAQSLAAGATAGATFGSLQVAAVPEPSTWALGTVGLATLGWMARRRR